MKYPIAVYLFGGEKTGWALDTDVDMTKKSLDFLPELIQFTSLEDAAVVHSVWEYPLIHMNPELIDGKRILCHMCNDLRRTYEAPYMVSIDEILGLWIANSKAAFNDIKKVNKKVSYVPYSVDMKIFSKERVSGTQELQKKYNLPNDKIIISNFMRDTSGTDLKKPKEQKGVDIFVSIVTGLFKKNIPIHVLIAGPRRHWVRNQLSRRKVPFSFIGKIKSGDDNNINILNSETINELYHASNLHLVTSRWEGGPRSVLECASTEVPVFSTPVGIASEILEPEFIIESVDRAISKIEKFIITKKSYSLKKHSDRIKTKYTPQANSIRFKEIYKNIESVPIFDRKRAKWFFKKNKALSKYTKSTRKRIFGVLKNFLSMRKKDIFTIGLWHEFHKPPYGGGNQFMLALKKNLERRGIIVVVNKIKLNVDVYICNSAWFDEIVFERAFKKHGFKMIHRIDGPVSLYRGESQTEDDKIFNLNSRFASATVFQSAYSLRKSIDLGYVPVSPMIIHNSIDEDLFHKMRKKKFNRNNKIKLISTSWSDNPRKGGEFYKWVDVNLDFNKFEYSFVGRIKQDFKHINHIPPKNSEQLGDILRQHDIFVSASHCEPCSNALIEALACGLPSIYRNDGGNPELVGFGGLPFEDERDFFAQLDRVVENHSIFQEAIYIKSMSEITENYLNLARKIVNDRK